MPGRAQTIGDYGGTGRVQALEGSPERPIRKSRAREARGAMTSGLDLVELACGTPAAQQCDPVGYRLGGLGTL
jgi:hypothetical protein